MKVLESFDFKTKDSTRQKYNWDKLTDGGIYQMSPKEDYTSTTDNFGAQVRFQAALRFKKVKVSADKDGVVTLQAFAMTGDEKDKEIARQERFKEATKVRLAKEKAEKAAKKAQANGTSTPEVPSAPIEQEAVQAPSA